jgi:glycosyltransferase involved in cell wall biosynthesis
VASAVGGIPEVVEPNERGLLVPPRDPAALASALRRLLTDEPLRRRLSGNALPYVRSRFDWPMIAAKIEEVYRELA